MITLEDVNSALSRYGFTGIWHEIDTSLINSTYFEDVKYDFCTIGHYYDDELKWDVFTFKIENCHWTGAFYVLNSEGEELLPMSRYTAEDNILKISFDKLDVPDSIRLFLYLHPNHNSFSCDKPSKEILVEGESDLIVGDHEDIGKSITLDCLIMAIPFVRERSFTLNKGKGKLNDEIIYFFVRKIDYELELNSNLTMGSVNTVTFNTPDKQEIDAVCTCEYLDKSVDFMLSDGRFELDLSDYASDNDLEIKVKIWESDIVLSKTTSFKLPVSYVLVSNYTELVNSINNGASILELTDDFEFFDNVYVSHDVLIYGEEYNVDMSDYSFIVASNTNLKLDSLNISNGNPVVLQRKDSKVDLSGCSFTGARNAAYNNLGSVVACDIDISSLSVSEDYITNITDCLFTDNHCCILHGGTLTLINSKYHNTNTNMVDINNPAFLYQVDGEALITDSTFDITYTGDAFETMNINYGQALFMCGVDATVNNATQSDLRKNVNFSNTGYNNISHIYCTYYYPQIDELVVSSPVTGKEHQALCYALSGVDWIFKSNVQITRESEGMDNPYNPIIWE